MTARTILPSRHQRPLPLDRLLIHEPAGADALEMDVVIVGGGPSGLACAIELSRLARNDAAAGGSVGELQIAVLEKAAALGEHCLSGAVINPRSLLELFPDLKVSDLPFRKAVTDESVYFLTSGRSQRIPTPPTMHNEGFYTASICELVRWLGERAEELGVNIFPGFPVDSLLVDGTSVRGVRTTPSGLDRTGQPQNDYDPPTELTARVTVLAEGTRGSLSQAWMEWQKVSSANPQIFALGVKEVWRLAQPLDRVIHTMGWPVPGDAFGGSFLYPLGQDQASLGLVVGLDYRQTSVDVHVLLQRLKMHPLFRPFLEGGEMLEWGAKTIPEGGYHALPERRTGDGVLIVGDSAGFVDVPSLKGIHYAVQSGIYAARAIFAALQRGGSDAASAVSAASLAAYDQSVNDSYIRSDLYRTRNMRLAFRDGFYSGAMKAGLMTVTGGRFPGDGPAGEADAEVPRTVTDPDPFTPDGTLTTSKLDAVFKSGNATRDSIPSHLLVGPDITPEVADFYVHMCPAGVYERDGDGLRVNPANCIDCKATDDLGPRWTTRERGSGARYRLM
jgi:electron-transferring-flavoprotein dehydrogenase